MRDCVSRRLVPHTTATRAMHVALLLVGASGRAPLPDDHMLYNEVLWAGTHNSAINLGAKTLLRPSDAQGGAYPSEAHLDYQYIVMDQRLSIRDQLDQGVRVLDFEVAALSAKWICSSADRAHSTGTCKEEVHLNGRCFSDCPFIVSHGSLEESIGTDMGYTFPESLFSVVAAWVKEHPAEIVTLLLIATHGNAMPVTEAVTGRMQAAGLLEHVWNPEPAAFEYPTLGQMRAANKTVLIANGYASGGPWGPSIESSHCNSSDITDAGEKCGADGATPCMEGWDTVSFFQLDASRAILGPKESRGNASAFAIENLSSRRGRDSHSNDYTKLPNELVDVPFQAGGNPAQAAQAADYDHIVALEGAFAALLHPFARAPNWILVDFFNTSTPKPGVPSTSLRPNPNEGLIRAVHDINVRRLQLKTKRRGVALKTDDAPTGADGAKEKAADEHPREAGEDGGFVHDLSAAQLEELMALVASGEAHTPPPPPPDITRNTPPAAVGLAPPPPPARLESSHMALDEAGTVILPELSAEELAANAAHPKVVNVHASDHMHEL